MLGPVQVDDILRFAAPRRPRRLNVQVSRILGAATSDVQIIAALIMSGLHKRRFSRFPEARFVEMKHNRA